MQLAQTAVIVPVPQAEHAVSGWRSRLEPAAGWGVPAHITVLYPFLPPERIDGATLTALGNAARTVPRFVVTFRRAEWFGDSVAWLAPEPDAPLRALVTAVWRQFPETPPYGGAYPDVVPHLTVADGGPPDALREAAAAVQRELPIQATVNSVQVLVGSADPQSWHVIAELPLG